MNCQRCKSRRILSAGCTCSDMFYASIQGKEYDGYVPNDLGVGGRYGYDLDIEVCLDCGQLQGKFPLPVAEMEK